MRYLTKNFYIKNVYIRKVYISVVLCAIMGALSACGSVGAVSPPKFLPHDFPSGTLYPHIDKPVNPSMVEKNSQDADDIKDKELSKKSDKIQ